MHTIIGRPERRQSKPSLTCAEVREANSARFDHEPAALSPWAIASHITGCRTCQEFEPAFADLGRRVRTCLISHRLMARYGPEQMKMVLSRETATSGQGETPLAFEDTEPIKHPQNV